MSTLKIERIFPVTPEKLFAFVTESAHLLAWSGPEGTEKTAHSLNLVRLGPWSSTLVNAEGGLLKMSGQVVSVDRPNTV
jgi:uncharacterized protein YndB with AHSA1/START domain